jgi:hypothetical protein
VVANNNIVVSQLINQLGLSAGGAAVPAVPRADAGGVVVVRGGGGRGVGADVHGAGAAHHLAAVPVPPRRGRGAGARGEPGARRGRRRSRRRTHGGVKAEVHRPPAPAAASAAAARHDAGRRVAAPARPPRALRLHPPRMALRALPAPVSTE